MRTQITPFPTGAGEQNAARPHETQAGTKSAVSVAPSSSAAMDATTHSSGEFANPEQDLDPNSDSQMPAVQSGTPAEEEDPMQVSVSEEPTEEQDQLQVSVSEGPAEEEDPMQVSVCEEPTEEQDQLQVSASEGPADNKDDLQVDASQEPAEPEHVVIVSEGEQRRRADTPEELANLGKAVDMVQARSCQLSPSLLTVAQTPPNRDSPARHAFERGRHDPHSSACT